MPIRTMQNQSIELCSPHQTEPASAFSRTSTPFNWPVNAAIDRLNEEVHWAGQQRVIDMDNEQSRIFLIDIESLKSRPAEDRFN